MTERKYEPPRLISLSKIASGWPMCSNGSGQEGAGACTTGDNYAPSCASGEGYGACGVGDAPITGDYCGAGSSGESCNYGNSETSCGGGGQVDSDCTMGQGPGTDHNCLTGSAAGCTVMA